MINRSLSLQVHDTSSYQLSDIALEKGYHMSYHRDWEVEENFKDKLWGFFDTILSTKDFEHRISITGLKGKALLDLNLSPDNLSFWAYTENLSEQETAIKSITDAFPPAPEQEDKVAVKFWYNTPQGPNSMTRGISCPDWAEIKGNYSANIRTELESLGKDFRPGHGGQLILWHGLPGTGKTFGLRALCREWAEWCDTVYITDPEVVFGYNASYLMTVLADHDDFDEDAETKRWKLLILEDTGEMISETAKQEAGQGLSRLLNVVDGFIGQGLRILVLITTNEKVERLHPAVSRPGRCAAILKFDSLPYTESVAWLKKNKVKFTLPKKDSYTLAELFAIKNEFRPLKNGKDMSQPIGFRFASA